MIGMLANDMLQTQGKKSINVPEFCSSNGSNSPSAHESVFHTAVEFEFVGLVIIWFDDDKFGKSFGRLFWSIAFVLTSFVSFAANFGLFRLDVSLCNSLSPSSFSSRSSSFCEMTKIRNKFLRICILFYFMLNLN